MVYIHCLYPAAGQCLEYIEEVIGETWACQTTGKAAKSGTLRVIHRIIVRLKVHAAHVPGWVDNAIKSATALCRIRCHKREIRQRILGVLCSMYRVTTGWIGASGYDVVC